MNLWSIKSNKALFNLLSIMIFLITFNNVDNTLFKSIGLFGILFLLGYSSLIQVFLIAKGYLFRGGSNKFIYIYSLMVAIYSLGIFFNPSSEGIVGLLELILILNFFIIHSYISYDKTKLSFRIIFICLTFFLVLFYLGIAMQGISTLAFKSIYSNSNTLGITTLLFAGISVMLFLINKGKIYILYAFLFLILTVLSGTRSSMIAVLISAFLFFVFKYISKNKFIWNFTLYLVICILLMFTYIYPNIDSYSSFSRWDSLFYNLTGKVLLSGRNTIWKECLILIYQKPFFGYGTGSQLSNITDIQVSAHNLYLQIILQNGLVGFLVFVFLLISIWNLFYRGRNDILVRFCASFFISILIQNVFEVTFLQNNMAISILQWIIISVGVSRSKIKEDIGKKKYYE